MDPVNNQTAVQGKLPSSTFAFLSSLGAALGVNGGVDSPFANILLKTQVQTPPNNAPANSGNQQSSQNAQNASPNGTNNTPDASSSTISWSQIKKFLRSHVQQANDKNSSSAADNNDSQPSADTSTQINTDQTSVNANVSATASVDNSTVVNTKDNSTDQTNTNINVSTDATSGAASNQTIAPADPAVNADANSAVENNVNIVTVFNVVTAVNEQPVTSNTTGNSNSDDASNSNNDNSNNLDITESELMALLLQLERLATTQLAGNTALDTAPNTNSATTELNTDTTVFETANANVDTQSKIDLKALLSAIADLNKNGAANLNAQIATTTDDQNTGQDPAVTASLQTTVSTATSTPTTTDTNHKWISAEFLSLFNVSVNNPVTTAPVYNPGVVTNAMITGDNGTSLDADAQGQNGASLRNGSSTLLSANSNSLLPPTSAVQATSPYDFASQLSALRAAKGGAAGLPTPVEQVILQLSKGISKDGSSQMTIQLRPAELGRIDIRLHVDGDGKVMGTVTADNSTTLGLLLKDVGGLERALQDAGLRADSGSLQFNLRGDGQAGSGFNQADNQPGFTNDNNASSNLALNFANPVDTYYLTPGGVNIRV